MLRACFLVASLASVTCSAQATGTFSLQKTTFAPGEPVLLAFTLRNTGKEVEEVLTADPYSICSGYKVLVTRDTEQEPTCSVGGAFSCMSGALELAPGASNTAHILLNFQDPSHQVPSTPIDSPGDYTIEASRQIAFGPPGKLSHLYALPLQETIRQTLRLHVDDSLQLGPDVFTPFVQQLRSTDERIRREAARTLATMAPAELEPLLLTFATSKDYVLKSFAPLALSTLGTKTSLSALAQMLLHTLPGTYEYMSAAEALGRTRDPVWFPLLLEVADHQGAMYLRYAAEAGGAAAIPALLGRFHNPGTDTRANVIFGLGQTGSREAVQILIGFFNGNLASDDERNLIVNANVALRDLTHVYADPIDLASMVTWQHRWQDWWSTNGSTAPIYESRRGECSTDAKLP